MGSPNGTISRIINAIRPGSSSGSGNANRPFSLGDQNVQVGDIYKYKSDPDGASLASIVVPAGNNGSINILRDYIWTLSNRANQEIPYIILREYQMSEALIKQQVDRYTGLIAQGAANIVNAVTGGKSAQSQSMLSVYKDMLPKQPTKFVYTFPFFEKTAIELSTSWKDIADAGNAISKLGDTAAALVKGMQVAGSVAAAVTSPSIGIQDRPKIFESHTDRTININFTLYNTVRSEDYVKNKNFIQLFTTQNLFNKRDYITGKPPVFYDVLVPGQYFSYASHVSNLRVENLGNIRMLGGEIVPDAYQIQISLTEMMKPSRNQFEAIFTGEGSGNVQ